MDGMVPIYKENRNSRPEVMRMTKMLSIYELLPALNRTNLEYSMAYFKNEVYKENPDIFSTYFFEITEKK